MRVTKPNTSTFRSEVIMSSMASITMKVPVRPTPALQCTTMAPAYCGLQFFTFFRNLSMPMGVKGTPKSGQLVKCSWVTSRGVLELSLPCCYNWQPLSPPPVLFK
jgi:hypothetical protein